MVTSSCLIRPGKLFYAALKVPHSITTTLCVAPALVVDIALLLQQTWEQQVPTSPAEVDLTPAGKHPV